MPFVQTALVDSSGTKMQPGSAGEAINHYSGVTLRVVGDGNLDMTISSQDSVREREMLPLPMAEETEKQLTRLVNFSAQRAFLTISTDQIQEVFTIGRIIIWVKPLYSGYSQ